MRVVFGAFQHSKINLIYQIADIILFSWIGLCEAVAELYQLARAWLPIRHDGGQIGEVGEVEDIELVERQNVLEIFIDRPAKKNALTSSMYRVMTDALNKVALRSDIGAVMFAGRGSDFCAGNDLKDFSAGVKSAQAAFDFMRSLALCEKPVVAAVQGLAVGIGSMLLHCDLVYAAANARFLTPFVKLGLVPEAGSSLLAPITMGYARAAAMLLLGDPLDAVSAHAAGLVTAVVPNGELLEHARSKADALISQPPLAIAAARSLMRGDRTQLIARIEREESIFLESLAAPEAREALAAFFEKRPPNFRRHL